MTYRYATYTYGNLAKATLPSNDSLQRMEYRYTYDNNVLDVNAEQMTAAAVLTDSEGQRGGNAQSSSTRSTGACTTKHYYVGSDRLCARIGGGDLAAPTQEAGLPEQAMELFNRSAQLVSERELDENSPGCIHTKYSDYDEILQMPVDGVPRRLEALVQLELSDFKQNIVYYTTHSDREDAAYFYHGDHLGSASWITDADGTPVQHLQYLPFGEPFVNQRTTGYSERFTFTGKERDSETGYSYFGARYYDSDLSGLFLSVDPMSDKYPSISPYAYCAWNPLKLVDPDGMEVSEHIDDSGNIIAHYDDGDNSVYLHDNSTTKESIDLERAIRGNTGGQGEKVGTLGGEIDMSGFFTNKLDESGAVASLIGEKPYTKRMVEYAKRVKTHGIWDLKNNKKTIWGVAWAYDRDNQTETIFNCDFINDANAADVGNFHAGFTGIRAGISPYILCKGAGAAETIKSFRKPKILDGLYRLNSLLTPLNRQSGDKKRDYLFNTMGMRFAEK